MYACVVVRLWLVNISSNGCARVWICECVRTFVNVKSLLEYITRIHAPSVKETNLCDSRLTVGLYGVLDFIDCYLGNVFIRLYFWIKKKMKNCIFTKEKLNIGNKIESLQLPKVIVIVLALLRFFSNDFLSITSLNKNIDIYETKHYEKKKLALIFT